MSDLENPWLGRDKYVRDWVLRVDEGAVERYQTNPKRKPEHRLQTHVVPEPWCGPIRSATVLALSGNPHWDHRDEGMPQVAFDLMEENLSGSRDLFWLDPRVEDLTGAKWYREKLLKDVLGHVSEEVVAKKFCLVDFVGYRSHRWDTSLRGIPSQQYTVQEIERAMSRHATIVLTRGASHWIKMIPALREYRKVFRNSSVQNVRISERNTKLNLAKSQVAGFEEIVGRLAAD